MASPLFFIITFTLSTIINFSLSSSQSILFPLTHSLSKTQFASTHHLLKSTTTNSLHRFHHHHRKQNHRHHRNRQVSLPLSPGSDYTLSFSLGTNPVQKISLYMDTGSDMIWFPCFPFECILCEGEEVNPNIIKSTTFNSSSSLPISCKEKSCSAAHSSVSNSDLCAITKCSLDDIEVGDCSNSCPLFYYAYGDGSFIGELYKDKLEIPMLTDSVVLKNFTFGCAHSALAEPVGVAGFGNGVLSLPAQLASFSPHLGLQFSYCLVSHSFDSGRLRRPSPLILGRNPDYDREEKTEERATTTTNTKTKTKDDQFVYTRMLDNPKHSYFYSVGLEGVTVGKRKIAAPLSMTRVDEKGDGGMVVDSGTTYTMLPSSFYSSVVAEFDRYAGQKNKRASEVEDKTGLSPCYYFDNDHNKSTNQTVENVPVITLHFVGQNSNVVLPRRNYFHDFIDGSDGHGKKRKVGCMMLMNSGDESESSGPVATLGNYQQQGLEVLYDLENRRIGFAKRRCASLWDNLNKR